MIPNGIYEAWSSFIGMSRFALIGVAIMERIGSVKDGTPRCGGGRSYNRGKIKMK